VAGGSSIAQDESAIVGFVRVNLDAGLHLIGVPLQPFSSETNGAALEESFGAQLQGGTNAATADQVGLYEADGEEAEMLWKDESGQFRDGNGDSCTAVLTAGSGFWLELRGPRELVLTGELRTDGAEEVVIESGVQIISVPLPMQVSLSDITATRGAIAAAKAEEADQFGVYDRASGKLRWAWLSADGWRWVETDSTSNAQLSTLNFQLSAAEGFVFVHQGVGFVLKKGD
jgi:hypothetical protein